MGRELTILRASSIGCFYVRIPSPTIAQLDSMVYFAFWTIDCTWESHMSKVTAWATVPMEWKCVVWTTLITKKLWTEPFHLFCYDEVDDDDGDEMMKKSFFRNFPLKIGEKKLNFHEKSALKSPKFPRQICQLEWPTAFIQPYVPFTTHLTFLALRPTSRQLGRHIGFGSLFSLLIVYNGCRQE